MGYGPTLASEVLRNEHGIVISREKLRTVLTDRRLWVPKRYRFLHPHPPRNRSTCVGAMILVDGSTHQWLKGHPECCLLVFIDDATSRLMHLHLTEAETSFDYLRQWKTYVEKYGRPMRVYGDGHAALFRRSWKRGTPVEESYTSDLARSLSKINVRPELSCSAQSRGRVERAHRTLQDRLVKFLQRRGATTLGQANRLLPEYMAAHNDRFSLNAPDCQDRHRPVPSDWDLDLIFSHVERRRVSRALTIPFEGRQLVLQDTLDARAAIGHMIDVHQHDRSRITLRFADKTLQYRTVSDPDRRPRTADLPFSTCCPA